MDPARARKRTGRTPSRDGFLQLSCNIRRPAPPRICGLGFSRSLRIFSRRRNHRARVPEVSGNPMSKYVITGGAGFIGSAIVRALLREGADEIVVLDNFLTGREENLAEVRKAIDVQRADIRNYAEIAPILKGASVVFHEAAIPSVPRSIHDPVPSHEVNI